MPSVERPIRAHPLARVESIGTAAVSDGDDAHGLLVLELVDDPVGANAVGTEPTKSSTELVPRLRLTLEDAQGVQDRLCKQKVQRR